MTPRSFIRLSAPCLAIAFCSPLAADQPVHYSWAQSPPMGWNSWDCFATTVTEAQTRAQIDVMGDKLASHGWNLITVDIQWYEPNATGFDYRKGAKLEMDEFGRLIPAANRFPSSAGGKGFKELADYTHSKGLKFGVHLLRGIPRQAVAAKTPVKGTGVTAADIADSTSVCPWNSDMYGVDMTKPGAQEYYDSVFELFASWGIDFVKVDDLSAPYHKAEIEGIRNAIDHSGRAIVFSTSPGATPLHEGAHISTHANMWRISGDFWDKWSALLAQFDRLNNWTPFRGPGHFPDADMLPLGIISMGKRSTNFTPAEQGTLLTLWSIARSPLILGADLTKLDDATLALITNDEVIAVDQSSANNRQLFHRNGMCAWTADMSGASDKVVALFNTTEDMAAVSVHLSELGLAGTTRVRDLWARQDIGVVTSEFAPVINAHSAGLYRFSAAEGGAVSYSPATLPGDGLAQHPFLYTGEWDTRKPWAQSMFIVRNGKVVWQYSIPIKAERGGVQEFDDVTMLPNGNILFSRMSGAGIVTPEKKLAWDYRAPVGTEVHSAQYLGHDRVLIMRNGNPAQAMIFDTASNTVEKVIPIPTTVKGTHGQFRHIRMTPAGTILVPHMGEGKVVEYDLDGKAVWSVQAPHVWQAVRLKNGNTLLSGDPLCYAREVNPKGETVWEFTQADLPDIRLIDLQGVYRLANGNTVLCNWCSGGLKNTADWADTVQVLEVTAGKKVVWALRSWKDPEDLGTATAIQLLDQPDEPADFKYGGGN